MRQLLKSKKGSEMTIGTIIIIILALVVLIFLIYSFMKGGGSLMDTLGNFFGGGPNVDTIKNSCQAACTTQSVYSYCSEVRTLKISDKSSYLGSCKTLSSLPVAGISGCPDINCGEDALPKKCGDIEAGAQWSSSTCVGAGNDLTSKVQDSGNNDIKVKPYCCGVVDRACTGTAALCTTVAKGSCLNQAGCEEPKSNTTNLCVASTSGVKPCNEIAIENCTRQKGCIIGAVK